MDFIYVGKFVNTHGLKGEIRIISNFAYKDIVFKPGFAIYFGQTKKGFTIKTYRKHKMYDMVTLIGLDKIEDVLPYKGMDVFIKRNSIKIDGLFDEDYIGLDVYTNHYVGTVYNIKKGKAQDLLVIKDKDKQFLVPKVDALIEKVNIQDKKLWLKEIGGLVDED